MEAVIEDPSSALPTVSEDLPGSEEGDLLPSNAGPASESESDEEEWHFSKEIRIEGDEDPDIKKEGFAAAPGFDAGFDEAGISFDAAELEDGDRDLSGIVPDSFDFETTGSEDEDANALSLDLSGQPEEIGVEPGRDGSSFGSVEDFSTLPEGESFAAEEDPSDLGSGQTASLEESAGVGVYSVAGAVDDLGEPESWDLTPGADFGSSKASRGRAVESFPRIGSTGSDEARRIGSLGLESGHEAASCEDGLAEPSSIRAVGVRLASFMGWVCTVAAVVAVTYLSIQPEWMRWASRPQILSVGSFVAETTRSVWVETSRSGSVLVVSGRVRNAGERVIWPQDLELVLHDEEGRQIPGIRATVGDPLPEAILREAPAETLSSATVGARQSFVGVPLAPGEARSFQAILQELPRGARRMSLQVADEEVSGAASDRIGTAASTAIEPSITPRD